jgi:hypothetical protein
MPNTGYSVLKDIYELGKNHLHAHFGCTYQLLTFQAQGEKKLVHH